MNVYTAKTVDQIKAELNAAHSDIAISTRINAYRSNIETFSRWAKSQQEMAQKSTPPFSQFWNERAQESLNTVTACQQLIVELTEGDEWQGVDTRNSEGREQ